MVKVTSLLSKAGSGFMQFWSQSLDRNEGCIKGMYRLKQVSSEEKFPGLINMKFAEPGHIQSILSHC